MLAHSIMVELDVIGKLGDTNRTMGIDEIPKNPIPRGIPERLGFSLLFFRHLTTSWLRCHFIYRRFPRTSPSEPSRRSSLPVPRLGREKARDAWLKIIARPGKSAPRQVRF